VPVGPRWLDRTQTKDGIRKNQEDRWDSIGQRAQRDYNGRREQAEDYPKPRGTDGIIQDQEDRRN
jgi:hypothetical protein